MKSTPATLARRRVIRRWMVFLVPFTVALLIRAVHFAAWAPSPFRLYNFLPGLDMLTHMVWGEQFASTGSFFSLYVTLPGMAMMAAGQETSALMVVVIQLFLGACTAGLTALICLWTLRRAWAAIAAGCLFALYGPPLIYETAVLKEPLNLFLMTSLLASIMWADKSGFRIPQMTLAGAIAALPPLLRFSGILWSTAAVAWLLGRWWLRVRSGGAADLKIRKSAGSIGAVLAGAAVICLFFLVLKKGDAHGFLPGKEYTRYIVSAGAQKTMTSTSQPQSGKGLFDGAAPLVGKPVLIHYLRKGLAVFSAVELPDNLNYYFMKHHLLHLEFLPGPLLLIPLGTAGLLWLLVSRVVVERRFERFGALLLYAGAAIAPMVLFLPLARYRLVLVPLFCVGAVYPFVVSARMIWPRGAAIRRSEVFGLGLFCACWLTLLGVGWKATSQGLFRSEDFLSYGISLKKLDPGDDRILEYSAKALAAKPDSRTAAVYLSREMLSRGWFNKAVDVLAPFHQSNPKDATVAIDCAAAFLGLGQFERAEWILACVDVNAEPPQTRLNHLSQTGECKLLLKKYSEAEDCFQKLYDAAEDSSEARERARQRLAALKELRLQENTLPR